MTATSEGARGPRLSLIAATFTAFAEDGALDVAPIEAQAVQLVEDGVRGAFVCGSTGEGPALTSAERAAVAERWCEVAGDKLRIIVQVGHASLPEACALAERAAAAGAHAIAAVPPFYYPPGTVDELVACCAEIAAAAPGIPFVYYHIPARTGVRLPMPPFIRAARERIPSFGGLKFTHTDLVEMARCVEAAAETDGVEVLSGPDDLLLDALVAGVRGAVGSSYNFAAPLFQAIGDAFDAGDMARAIELQARARRLVDLGHRHGGLPAFKALGSLRGVEVGGCRLPLGSLDAAGRAALREEAAALGLLDAIGSGATRVV